MPLPRPLFTGSGTGVLGMALGALGANVIITDLRDELPHIERNLEHNAALWAQQCAHRPAVREHAWGADMDWLCEQRFDYVVGSDLLYFGGWDLMAVDTREPLLQSLAAAVSATSEALLVWVVRHPQREEAFVRDAARRFLARLHTAAREADSGGNGQGYAWSEGHGVTVEASWSGCLVEGTPVCLQLWHSSKA